MVEGEEFGALLEQAKRRISKALEKQDFDEVLRLTRSARDLEAAVRNLRAAASQVAAELKSDGYQATVDRKSAADSKPRSRSSQASPEQGAASAEDGAPFLGLSNKAKGNQLREHWLRTARDGGIRLHRVKGVVFETQNGKRVGIPSASEVQPDKWWLGLPDEHFDFLVLLCKPQSGSVLDFVLPSDLVAKVWPRLSKHHRYRKIHVQQFGNDYRLEPGAGLFPIREYLGKLEILL